MMPHLLTRSLDRSADDVSDRGCGRGRPDHAGRNMLLPAGSMFQ